MEAPHDRKADATDLRLQRGFVDGGLARWPAAQRLDVELQAGDGVDDVIEPALADEVHARERLAPDVVERTPRGDEVRQPMLARVAGEDEIAGLERHLEPGIQAIDRLGDGARPEDGLLQQRVQARQARGESVPVGDGERQADERLGVREALEYRPQADGHAAVGQRRPLAMAVQHREPHQAEHHRLVKSLVGVVRGQPQLDHDGHGHAGLRIGQQGKVDQAVDRAVAEHVEHRPVLGVHLLDGGLRRNRMAQQIQGLQGAADCVLDVPLHHQQGHPDGERLRRLHAG